MLGANFSKQCQTVVHAAAATATAVTLAAAVHAAKEIGILNPIVGASSTAAAAADHAAVQAGVAHTPCNVEAGVTVAITN